MQFSNQLDSFQSQKIAVIGYGYWGQKLAKVLASFNQEVLVVDLVNQTRNFNFQQVSMAEVLRQPQIKAVVIATPEITHAKLIKQFLSAGKSILVEKPAATDKKVWAEITELASQKQLPVMVDYTFLYSQATVGWKQLELKYASKLGELKKLTSIRKSQLDQLKITSKNLPVWWDLAIHDIYLIRDIWHQSLSQWQAQSLNNTVIKADLSAKFMNGVAFEANYDWLEAPERAWRAEYEAGQLIWQKTLAGEKLQAIIGGDLVAEVTIEDTNPTPLDKVIFNWLTLINQPGFNQKYWRDYWKIIGADIKTIQDIDAANKLVAG